MRRFRCVWLHTLQACDGELHARDKVRKQQELSNTVSQLLVECLCSSRFMLIVTCSKSKVRQQLCQRQALVRRPHLPRLRQHNRILHAAVVIVDCQVYSMRIVTQLGLDDSSTIISEVVHLPRHTLWLFPARIA